MTNLKTWIILLLFGIACSDQKQNEQNAPDFRDSESLPIKYAKGFTITKSSGAYQLTLIKPFQDSDDTLNYFIENNGVDISGENVLESIEKVVLLSSTHAAFFNELKNIDLIKAISTRDYFYNEKIQRQVEAEKIIEVGIGQGINTERLIMLNPDVMLISGTSSKDFSEYKVLEQAGITIIPIAEWQEQHPLGRAEWIKAIGVITGKYEMADSIFNEVVAKYQELNAMNSFREKPKVIINAPYKDNWWLPGGSSYVSKLLQDAGSDYPWKENKATGGLQADFEVVFHKARDAKFWINPGNYHSLKDLLNHDERYSEFLAFQNGNVYNNNRRAKATGGNDYYETGTVRPNIILADLIKIFHPEKLPGHELYFYQQLK